MIDDKRVLGIIPARGGSKGLPGKNIRPLRGKPLIGWTIEAARRSKYIDDVVVTSDDPQILAVSKEWGASTPFVRPAELATDEATSAETVLHCLESVAPCDVLVLLQPTSPLRLASDIDTALEIFVCKGAVSVVSVTPSEKSISWSNTISPEGRIEFVFDQTPSGRRQDLSQTYYLNGAVYCVDCDWFKRHRKFTASESFCYVMPRERSIDIDTLIDFAFCEILLDLKKAGAI